MNVRLLAVVSILASLLAVGAASAAPAATQQFVAGSRDTQDPTPEARGSAGSETSDAAVRPIGETSTPTQDFMAVLSGANEVPPRDTEAYGSAGFRWDPDAGALEFRVFVRDISNVFAAHVHCGPAGVNAPVGITLFSGSVGAGPFAGLLANGILTAPDAGNACGWADLAAAVAAMQAGLAYVNVHTNDGVDPANTGPGDFPGCEIRGQIAASPPPVPIR